jgi:capsular exopolysaccharide synthesis family protein
MYLCAVGLADHLRIIWQRRWRVLGIALVLAVLVYARGKTLEKQYASEAPLQVTAATSNAGDQATMDTTAFLAARYARLAVSDPVLLDAVKRSALPITLDQARDRATASSDNTVGFITIRTSGPNPKDAQTLATSEAAALVDAVAKQEQAKIDAIAAALDPQIAAVAAQLSATTANDPQRAALEAQYAALVQQRTQKVAGGTNRVEPIAEASLPTAPFAPTPLRDSVLAFILALILNAELWVVLEVVSDRFSPGVAAEEAQRITGLPVLAEVPRGVQPEAIEAFRVLRTNLMFHTGEVDSVGDNVRPRLRTLAVLGIEPGCGKSHTAIGLAAAASGLEQHVVLVDGDLRRPVIHRRLKVPVRPGLGDLRSKEDLDRVAHEVAGYPFLRVVSAGTEVADPSGLLGGDFRHVLELITPADLIVVDTPSASLFADATAIAAQCDVTILVMDPSSTRRRSLVRLVENLRRVNANPVGIVVNRVDRTPGVAHYYNRPEPPRSAR